MPTASIVTSVGPAHLEGFGSLEAVAEEKGSIYDLLPDDGLAILPQQDPFTPTLQRHIHKRKVTYAVGWPADLTAEQVEATAEGSRFRARGVEVFLPLAGVHNVSNCLAAMLAAEYLGIGIEEAAAAVADMSPVHDRLERIVTPHLVVLDDAYNANPGSLRAAAETLALFDAPRRIAIVGDMLELGEHSRALHKDAGRFLTTLEIDIILAVGPKSVALAEAASTASVRGTVRHYKTVAALLRQLPEFLTPGDLVLVKGSRGMKMERVVQALKRWSPSEAE
jgi:UDP-N-acetylmuramoyl-tripeptide--D-alanyl-D-alanine ligase